LAGGGGGSTIQTARRSGARSLLRCHFLVRLPSLTPLQPLPSPLTPFPTPTQVDSMIPVIGIGSAFQPSRPGGGVHHTFAWQRPGAFAAAAGAAAGAPHVIANAEGPLSGGGVVMWHTADGRLAMAGLPAPPGGAVQYAAGDDSDDPDAEAGHTQVLQAPSLGEVRRGGGLRVAWRGLGGGQAVAQQLRRRPAPSTPLKRRVPPPCPPASHPASWSPSTRCSCSPASARSRWRGRTSRPRCPSSPRRRRPRC
jgi:hypothetical protein